MNNTNPCAGYDGRNEARPKKVYSVEQRPAKRGRTVRNFGVTFFARENGTDADGRADAEGEKTCPFRSSRYTQRKLRFFFTAATGRVVAKSG